MKVYSTTSGPFRQRPYFAEGEIEILCRCELEAAELYPSSPGPIRVDRLIEKRFNVVPTYDDLPDGVLGVTEFGPKWLALRTSLLRGRLTKTEALLRNVGSEPLWRMNAVTVCCMLIYSYSTPHRVGCSATRPLLNSRRYSAAMFRT